MTYHKREDWQDPRYPVFGPVDNINDNDTVVLHYTAADDLIDGDPGEHAEDLPQYLRNMQYYYVTQRGYSLGYSFAVDWLGGVWQIRGWEFQSAANRGHNNHTLPILLLVDGDDPATSFAVAAVQDLVEQAKIRYGRDLVIVGHQDIGATGCPGAGIQAQIEAGVFEPRPVVPPVVDPIPEDDVMYSCKRADKPTGYHLGNGIQRSWVTDQDYERLTKAGVKFTYLGMQPVEFVKALGQNVPAS